MLRLAVEELSWRGKLPRTLEVGPTHLCALTSQGERQSTWSLADLLDIGVLRDRLALRVPCACGTCSRRLVYQTSGEHECKALATLLREAQQRPGGTRAFVSAMRDAMGAAYVSGLGPQKVVVIDPHLSIETAFQLLLDRNITSAPVVDPSAATDGRLPFVGFLDLRDLLASAVLSYRENTLSVPTTPAAAPTAPAPAAPPAAPASRAAPPAAAAPPPPAVHPHSKSVSCRSGLSACLRDPLFLSQSPSYLARRNPIAACRPVASLLDVCALLASGHRRVLLVDAAANAPRAVLSQSRMAGCILQAWQRLPALRASAEALRLSDFIPTLRKPIACDVHTPAIDAFELLVRHGISGLAIVDSEGKMQAALSAKDLRLVLRSGDVASLALPAIDYLRSAPSSPSPTVPPSVSIYHLFDRFVASGSHRLFVAETGGKLIGVVSLKDALALVIGSVHLELGSASRPGEAAPLTPPRTQSTYTAPHTR